MKRPTAAGGAPPPSSCALTHAESAKLVSLLALAAGAVAMPQTSNADVIYTDLSSNPALVGFGAGFGPGYAITNLPGAAQIGFRTHTIKTLGSLTDRFVSVSQKAGYAKFLTLSHFALPASAGKVWDQIRGRANPHSVGWIGVAPATHLNYPGSYDHLYLPFEFKDSTSGGTLLFGWMQVSLSNPQGGDPNFTLFGYAYDNTGAQIPMGATTSAPEPSSVAMMVLGALTLGAAGVRNWRRNRNPNAE